MALSMACVKKVGTTLCLVCNFDKILNRVGRGQCENVPCEYMMLLIKKEKKSQVLLSAYFICCKERSAPHSALVKRHP